MMKKVVLICAALAACTPKQAPAPAEPRQPARATGRMEQGMRSCPPATPGVQTSLRMTDAGIDVIMRAKDPIARAEMERLAELHAHRDRLAQAPEHSGQHGGPGTIGHCPIIHEGTKIQISSIPDGVVLHVTARTPNHVKSVQLQTVSRLHTMPQWLARSAQR
jgi:hypothetical protein